MFLLVIIGCAVGVLVLKFLLACIVGDAIDDTVEQFSDRDRE